MIVRDSRILIGGGPGTKELMDILAEHAEGEERRRKLKAYYLGKNAVLSRTRPAGLPNNRTAHAFARYIVTVTGGYLIGSGISYKAPEEDKAALSALMELYREGDIPSVDVENARNAAIFGKGVELICLPEDGFLPRVYALSPENAFVVYEDDIRHRPLLGVYVSGDRAGRTKVMVFTDSAVREYELNRGEMTLISEKLHFFGRVPMVEYWNDENEKGDFEWVLPLIDAYDSLQSDRLNDKDQFADKLLVLTGCTLDTDENGRPPWLQLRMDKALCLPDENADARYLSGEMNESGNEILRQSLEKDIHKLSMVPDLSDVSFAGNVSGIAMKYKLMGLEQLTNMKQKWFTEGLRERMRVIGGYLRLRGGTEPDVRRVSVIYNRALPENLTETASVIRTAREAGAVSTRTMVEMLHGGSDWDEKQIADETAVLEQEMK